MNNEPAFPSHGTMGEVNYQGMSQLDYFAGQVIIGIMANKELKEIIDRKDSIAQYAYSIAQAMLNESNKLKE